MQKNRFQRVLITGTTSGLGRAFHAHYAKSQSEVIEVNRRALSTESDIPVVHSEVLDIANAGEVYTFLSRLQRNNQLPDLFILNAGTNLADNLSHFDYANFQKVMQTNLHGVLTFISALQRLGIKNKTIVAVSSMTNIVPNTAHIGYHISKLALKKAFEMLQEKDPQNCYKTIVLGPVPTHIQSHYPPSTGFQRLILNGLFVPAEKVVERAVQFFESSKPTLYFPLKCIFFYWFAKAVLLFFPFLYKGTQTPQRLTLAEQQ